MKTIFKYELAITDNQYLCIPSPAEILHVGEQNGKLMLWAVVDNGLEMISIGISIFGTGNPASTLGKTHIGTVQMSNGLVWHIFRNEV